MPSSPVALAEAHQSNEFDSGVPTLDDWLRRRALLPNQRAGASRTYVTCEGDRVVGFYALASCAIATEAAVGKFRRNMPDPIPVVILARLAVAQTHHGRGLGRALFQDAARRVVGAADSIGIRGMIVHAISPSARDFYERLGLSPSPLEPMTLMATIGDLRASIFPDS